MQQLLTRRKQAWVGKRKPAVIRGRALNNPTVLELKYAQQLEQLVERMAGGVHKQLLQFFAEPDHAEYFDQAQDASTASQARILTNAMMRKFNAMFAAWSQPMAEAQMNKVDQASSASVHASMQELSGGLSLPTSALTSDMREVLSASIVENVALIKSISMQYLNGVQQATMRSITTGRGLADLVPYLEKHKQITKRRANSIALDQTRKAYNNLNRGRMQKLGLTKFEWLHTGGSAHPRKLHQDYNGHIFSFDEPPIIDENTGERGIPGQAINCRCRMRPVIDFGES